MNIADIQASVRLYLETGDITAAYLNEVEARRSKGKAGQSDAANQMALDLAEVGE